MPAPATEAGSPLERPATSLRLGEAGKGLQAKGAVPVG